MSEHRVRDTLKEVSGKGRRRKKKREIKFHLLGGQDELLVLLPHTRTDEERPGGIPVVPIQVHGDVYVQNIAILNDCK